MGAKEVDQFCQATPEAAELLKMSLVQMQLSARAYHRILKMARTIADLDESDIIEVPHLAEAIHYRPRRLTG
jgi:magnesium chelatase family protein